MGADVSEYRTYPHIPVLHFSYKGFFRYILHRSKWFITKSCKSLHVRNEVAKLVNNCFFVIPIKLIIMPLQPFTPIGVQDKQVELYALPDPVLHAEASIIRSDFRNWMKANFTLDATQDSYLDNLPDTFVNPIACDTALAVYFRLPIILVVIGPVSASKLIRTNPGFEYAFSPIAPGDGTSATGSLTVTMEYL